MALDRDLLFEDAKKKIVDNKLFFIEDVVDYIGISKTTFYEYYPLKSDEMNTIKDLLRKNKAEIKISMRNKWYKSSNATLQIALMKLIANEKEAHRLNGTNHKVDVTTQGESIKDEIDYSKLSDDTLKEIANAKRKGSE